MIKTNKQAKQHNIKQNKKKKKEGKASEMHTIREIILTKDCGWIIEVYGHVIKLQSRDFMTEF